MEETLLNDLVEVPSVSGYEESLQRVIVKELKSRGLPVSQDALGNSITTLGEGDEKILIAAHSDEVGFIITHISILGFLYFQPVGGVDADVAVGQPVVIQTKQGPVKGIIGKLNDWETASPKHDDGIVPYKNMWIDVGDNYHVRDYITVGDPVFFDAMIHPLKSGYMLARAADDRLGIYSALKIIDELATKQLKNCTLYTVITTREEVGSRGVQPAVRDIKTHYSIAIDTVNATDTPDSNKQELSSIELAQGPVLSRGSNTDDNLFFVFKQLAEKNKIPYQIEAQPGPMPSDIDPLQIEGDGSVAISVSIPIRYSHFPSSIFCWEDVHNTIKLVTLFIASLR